MNFNSTEKAPTQRRQQQQQRRSARAPATIGESSRASPPIKKGQKERLGVMMLSKFALNSNFHDRALYPPSSRDPDAEGVRPCFQWLEI